MFGSEAWDHVLYEKWKALQPKSEKCIFVGCSKDVKGYRLLQSHSHDIIIRRDVKFEENILACEPNLGGMPSLAYEPDSAIVPSSSSSVGTVQHSSQAFYKQSTLYVRVHRVLPKDRTP